MFEPPLNADERGLWLECAGDLDRIDLFQHILYGAEAPPCMAEYLAVDAEYL